MYKLICCSLVLFASPAYCAPYLSAQLGAMHVTFTYPIFYDTYSYTTPKTSPITRLAGGYLWGKNERFKYGIETGLTFHNTRKDFHKIVFKHNQFQIDTLGVIDYYLIKKLDLFAKAGVAYSKQTTSMSTLEASGSDSVNNIFPKTMVGIGYKINQNVNINISLENNFNFNTPKRGLLAGFNYSF